MPYVTTNVRTWGIQNFPTSAALQMRFHPSTAAVADDRVYPQDDVVVDVPADGEVSVNLVNTSLLLNDVYFTVRFEWLDGGVLRWSELPGKLRVPTSGGDLKDLLETPAISGILYGYGPPPAWLDNVIYLDTSGESIGVYLPEGAFI